MRKGIILSILAATLLWAQAPARAGTGFSYSRLMSAIASNNADVIASELEVAEFFMCGACIQPVRNLLDHDDYRVREAAAWWFAKRPMQRNDIREVAIARLYANDSVAARNAADALGTFRHPNAIAALSYAAGRTDLSAEARAAAVKALGIIGSAPGEAAIVGALADSDATVRVEALDAYLALRGGRDGSPLLGLLGDGEVTVRRRATAVLGSYRLPAARATFESLLASDPDFLVRRNAAWALGKLGDRASRPALEAARDHDASRVVSSVAAAAIRGLR